MMHEILDLGRYPLDQQGTIKWKNLVERCQVDLEKNGMFNLDGLMAPVVAQRSAAELSSKFLLESFNHTREHNIYFTKTIPDISDDHPALTRFNTSNDTLCWDQVTGTPMDILYKWEPFAVFLAAVMNKKELYPMEDTLAGLNVMSYREGQLLNWHFDRSEFTTTMLLQAPDTGGEFLYRSDLRSVDNPNYDGVARLLRGEDPEMRSLTLSPGTLNVFRGKNTPHKVAPVRGDMVRMIAVFSFFDKAGVCFSEEERLGFYGRAN